MSMRINVDPNNPGQFFACCGLLELAGRIWDEAEGWFESDNTSFVASSSNATFVEAILYKLEVYELFNVIVSGDMVTKGKPNPEIFLLAASRLDIKPENCLVIEDAIYGMQAAKSANMKCIGLVPDRNLAYPTTNLVESLTEVNFEFLEKLESINFSKCDGINNGIAINFKYFKNLKALGLSGCSNITNEIGKEFYFIKNLMYLELMECENITSDIKQYCSSTIEII